MFKKPVASLKSFSSLRSSDRRKLRDEILNSFPVLRDMAPINDIPVNAIITPEGLQAAKFTSYIEEPGTLYTDTDGVPLWFKISCNSGKTTIIVPSVYTLWRFPSLIPGVTTWNPVVDKLRNGADLMIPGVISMNDSEAAELVEGGLVIVRARGNRYPLAVGTLAVPGSTLVASRRSDQQRGKAVHVLHVHDDQLWSMGNKPDLPADWAAPIHGPDAGDYESSDEDEDNSQEQEITDALHSTSLTDVKGKAIARDEDPVVEETSTADLDDTHTADNGAGESSIAKDTLTTAEVDKYLQDALLQVLKFKITESGTKELLPMNASTLYSSFILPNRAQGRAAEADIKKSSWKKLAKWLKVAEKQDLIKCKETRGELLLLGVNWKNPELVKFTRHKTVEQEVAKQIKVEAESSSAIPDTKALEILEAYRPSSASAALFENIGRSKDGYYSAQELRSILVEYFKEKDLTDPSNKRYIRLDACLKSALAKKGENVDKLPRDQTVDRKSDSPRFVKGGVKPINILQETRTGRKIVTRISGLEHFLIDVDSFGQEIQTLCASSVSITPLVGASARLNLREVMVQGPQFKNLTTTLLERGVPKKYIEFLDKTSKK
ncbi:hypothetical protein BGW38_000218 [Lunasporangiospora selenospora]|uniref:Uncharacterized protein n=1 Tax=Lunasporangiospora selenospora TaxID=979761 RepID=A0A9P6KEZ4_9FUNG|nr:hypothetical protein BGW38_000218 [Lunasporangiospora selenospora]